MGIRAFRYYAITSTNVAQPCFGTTLSTALAPSTPGVPGTVTVADTSMLFAGYKAIIDPFQSTQETVDIQTIVDGTHFTANISQSHAAYVSGPGGFVVLLSYCASVLVNGLDGSAGDYFFGIGPSFKNGVTAGSGSAGLVAIGRKSPSGAQPPFFSSSNIYGMNPVTTPQFWIQGTANDVFCPSFIET